MTRLLITISTITAALLPLMSGYASPAPLTTLDYRIKGQVLEITPAVLSIPKGIPGSVATKVSGDIPAGSVVEATLRGPSFPARRVVGVPNQPLMLPPLNLSGDYSLDGIRLAGADGATLLEGLPASVPVQVFEEVLVSRVESRPLSLEEIQDRGIVIDENNFRAVEFEVGFVLDGQTIPVRFPVISPDFRQTTEIIPAAELEARLAEAERINRELGAQVQLPPALAVAQPNIEIAGLNFQFVDEEDADDLRLRVPPIPALMVIPGNIGYLNQFFSVMIFTENGSPAGSGLSVHSLKAELLLPPGPNLVAGTWQVPGDDPVRFARTGPEALISNILPVRQPGPDAKTGTPDDVDRLQPGDTGQAEFLVEGLQEGLHVLNLTLNAKLDGLAAGTVEVTGKAAGSVMVRNPKFSMAFSHPRTVRSGEPYDAYVTILNTSSSPANLVSVSLNRNSISGGILESAETVELGTIAPGQTAVANFRVRAQRTGAITFSNLTTGDDSVVGRFRLRTGIDERGVTLSPDTLLLPDFANFLPKSILSAANRMLGQALSSSTAGQLPAGVIPVSRELLRTKALELAEAGQRLAYGDPAKRVLADLFLDWHGGRATSDGWDQILRTTNAGREWAAAIVSAMEEADAAGAVVRMRDHAADWAGRGEAWWISGASDDAVALRLTGQPDKEAGLNGSTFPNAAGYPGLMGPALASRTGGVLHWELTEPAGGPVELALLEVTGGTARLLTWTLDIPPPAHAWFDTAGGGTDLSVDDDGNGTPDRTLAAVVMPFAEAPPAVVAVRQDPTVPNGRPDKQCLRLTSTNGAGVPISVNNYASVLAVLFSKPMTQATVSVPSAFRLDDGNEAYAVQIQPSGRVALLTMTRPVGALVPRTMTVTSDIQDARGNALASAPLPVQSHLVEGSVVRGRVVRADGSFAAGVPVTLTYYDEYLQEFGDCVPWVRRVAQFITGPDGEFRFDLVLAGVPFSLSATDTAGLSMDAVDAVLAATREDQLNREQLEALASSPGVRDTLLGEFAAGSLTEAVARAEGLDRALVRDMIVPGSPRIGTESVIALRFRGRGTVLGRVVASDGTTSAANAAVNLFPDPASRELGRGIVCDNEGRFAFFGVPLGNVSIEATARDGTTRTIAEYLGTSGEVRTVEIALSETPPVLTGLQGRVTEPDGSPHAGAQVYIGQYAGGRYCCVVAVARADNEGYWTVTNIPVGVYDPLAISADGRRVASRLGIAAAAGSVNTVNLALQARGTVTGRVESSTGVPVAGAIVGGGEVLVTSDALGRFTLTGVPTGSASIAAVLPKNPADPQSFARRGGGSVNVIAGAENFVIVRMEAVGRITGRVYDAIGRPVPNSDVAIPGGGGFYWTNTNGQGDYAFTGLGIGSYTLSTPAPPHKAAFDAAAVVDTLQNGTQDQVLAAVGEAFAAFTGVNDPLLNGEGLNFNPLNWGFVRNVSLNFDGQTVVADIRHLRTGSVSGTVVNGQNVPIGARVRLTGIGPTRTGSPIMMIRGERNSDPALGTFEFPGQLILGDWGLQAASPFFPVVLSTTGRTTDLAPDVTGIVMKFPAVQETNGRLSGQVLMPDGSPAGAGVAVKISFGNDFMIQTDAAGRFDTQITLPAGGYSIQVTDALNGFRGIGYVHVVAGQMNTATVRMLGRGNIELLVTEADGTPVPGAPVNVNGGWYPHERFNGVTGPDGRIAFSAAFEGPYGACASTVTGTARIAGCVSFTVPREGTGRATVALAATANVRGTFVSRTGTPIAFANVSLAGLAFGITDANGAFAFNDVPLGTYRLTGTDAVTGRSGWRQVTLSAVNENYVVQLVETALGEVTGAVINGYGTAFVPGAQVTLTSYDPTSPARMVTTGPDGRFRFPGTPAAGFRLTAYDLVSTRTGSATAVLPETAATLDINIQLQQMARAVVTVKQPDGVTPAALATVKFGSLTGDTDASGVVHFNDLLLGTYSVTAQSREPGLTRRVQGAVVSLTQTGGTAEVTLVLRGAGGLQGRVFEGDGVTPVPGAAVTLAAAYEPIPLPSGGGIASPVAGLTISIIAGPDGGFSFVNIPQGAVRLSAVSQALGASANVVMPADGVTVARDLTLTASGAVTGRLVRAGGTAVAGTQILVTFASQSGLPGRINAVSDAEGRFTAEPVPLGGFSVDAVEPSFGGIARVQGTVSANGQLMDLGDIVFDEEAPRVESVTPADTAAEVDIHTVVEMLMSEPLNPATVESSGVFLRPAAGGAVVPAALQLTSPPGESAPRLLRLTPAQPLASETAYEVIVVSGELLNAFGGVTNRGPRDRVGRPLAAMFRATFTTRDQRPPLLLSFTPANGAEQVDPSTPVRLSFDEPLQPGASIVLTGPGGPVAGTVSLGLNGLVLTFVPSVNLPPNAVYSVAVSGVRDIAGNDLAGQPLTRSFATLDTFGPDITVLRLKNNAAPVAGGAVTLEAVLAAAEAGVRVRFSADLVTLATTAVNVRELPVTLPLQGTVVYRAIAIDRFGNEGPLAELSVAVQENTPPVITFEPLNPLTGPVLSGSPFSVRVSATDDGVITDFRAVASGAATAALQSNATGAPITLQGTVPAGAAPGGKVSFTAQATDNSGRATGDQVFELTVADGTAPAVTIVSPAANATVDPVTPLLMELDTADNSGTVTLEVTLSGGATGTRTVAVNAAPNEVKRTLLNFDIAAAVPNGSTFTATAKATDAAGRFTSATRSFRLPDRRAPLLAVTVPAEGAVRQSLWTDVVLTFDEAMNPATFTPEHILFPGAFTVIPSSGNSVFTLRAAAALTPGTVQAVRLLPALADAAGNPWQDSGGTPVDPAGKVITFTTASFTATSPAQNAKVVPGQRISPRAEFEAGLGADQIAFTTLAVEVVQNVNPATSVTASAILTIPQDAAAPQALFTIARRSGRPSLTLPGNELELRPRADDDDSDTILNGTEADLGLDPFLDDRTLDPDNDGRNNGQEVAAGTGPFDPDSDDDGLNDGAEFTAGTNPLNSDTDGDLIPDGIDPDPLNDQQGIEFTVPASLTLNAGESLSVSVTAASGESLVKQLDLAPGHPVFADAGYPVLTPGGGGGSATTTLRLDPVFNQAGSYVLTVRAVTVSGTEKTRAINVTVLENPALAVTRWIAPVSGTWSDAARWDNGVPDATKVAVIEQEGTYTVTMNADATALGLLAGGASGTQTLAHTGGTFTLRGPGLLRTPVIYQQTGTLSGPGALTVLGRMDSNGLMSGVGGLVRVAAGAVMSLLQGRLGEGRELHNSGTVNLTRLFTSSWSGVVTNQYGGLFDLRPASGFSFGSVPVAFHNNAGAILRQSLVRPSLGGFRPGLYNNGTVENMVGTFTIEQGGSSTGTFTAVEGTAVAFSASYTFMDGTRFTGLGQGRLTGGTFTLPEGAVVSGERVALAGGILTGPGTWLVDDGDVFDWTGGTMADPAGHTRIAPGGAMNITGGSFQGRHLRNAGTVNQSGSMDAAQVGGTFTNETGGLWDFKGAVNFTGERWRFSFQNHAGATLRYSAGPTALAFFPYLSNDGTVDVQTGTFRELGSGVSTGRITVADGALMMFESGHTFHAGSAITGPGWAQLQSAPYQITVSEGAVVSGDRISMTSGILSGPGTWLVDDGDVFDWTGGTMADPAGGTRIAPGGVMNISGGSFQGRQLRNAGTVNQSGAMDAAQVGGTFTNEIGGLWDFKGAVNFTGERSRFSFQNQAGATLRYAAGQAALAFFPYLSNDGIVDVQTGTFRVLGSGVSTGRFTVADGALMMFETGHTFHAGSAITGPGWARLWSGANLLQGATVTGDRVSMEGIMSGPGTWLVEDGDVFNWIAGTMEDTAGLTQIAPGGVMNITGGSLRGRQFRNAGTVNQTGVIESNVFGTGTFVNEAGGLWDLKGTPSFGNQPWRYAFQNDAGATLRRSVGTGDVSFSAPLSNGGAVEVLTGRLGFHGGFTQTSGVLRLAGGSYFGGVYNIAGGTVEGTGTIFTAVNNIGGTVAAGPGLMTITEAYTQGAGGRLQLRLGTPARVFATAAASLAGELQVTLLPGFAAAQGSGFDVFTFPSRSGDFTSLTGLADNFGYTFARNYTAGAMNLFVSTAGSAPLGSPPLSGFAQWMAMSSARSKRIDGGESDDDPDHDGAVNLLEYAMGTDPFAAASTPEIVHQITDEAAGKWLLKFPQRTDTSSLRYVIETSIDCESWVPVEHTVEVGRNTVTGAPLDLVSTALWLPRPEQSRHFLRIRVEE